MDEAGVVVAIQTGMELGFSPARALTACPVINGTAGLRGNAAVALLRTSGVLDDRLDFQMGCEEGANGELYGWCRSWRKGWPEPRESFFTQADAVVAKLWDKKDRSGKLDTFSPWNRYPKRMLMWRAVGFHTDENYSDVCMGLQPPEVLYDYAPERVVNPAPEGSEADVGAQGPDPLLAGLLEPEDAEVDVPVPPGQGPVVVDVEQGSEPEPVEVIGETLSLDNFDAPDPSLDGTHEEQVAEENDLGGELDLGQQEGGDEPAAPIQPPAAPPEGRVDQTETASSGWLDDAVDTRGVYLKQRCGVQDPETEEPCEMAFDHAESRDIGKQPEAHSWHREPETGDVFPPELGGPGA
jgi:hypothetical protein